MVRVRAGETFQAAVERERKRKRRLSEPAPEEGITRVPAGATRTSTGRVDNGTKGRRRRGFSRGCGCGFDEPAFTQDSMSPGGADGPTTPLPSSVRTELPGSRGPEMATPQVRTEGAAVAKKSKVSGSCGPATPTPRVRTEGAAVAKKSKVSGSCGPATPPPGMQTDGAGITKKSKVPGFSEPEIPPPGMRTEGAGVSHISKGSVFNGPAMPPRGVRTEGAGVLELAVEDTDALDCSVCFLPLKPPIFQCCNGHVVCSLCHDKLKASGKCHVCGVTTDGNSRCHAMERLAESIRFLCLNAAYGCTARLVYHNREGHWQKCPHSPFCCPDKACSFIGPMELLLDHFACVHGWPSFTTALASGFNVSLRDGFNFLCAVDHTSSSPGVLFLLNVVRSPLGCAISMLCIDTRATNNGQGQFSKEPIECELTYSRNVSSKSRSPGDRLTNHYQRCKFRIALTDRSKGLPSNSDCFQFVVSNFALGEENKEMVPVQGRIFINSINLC